MIDLHDPKQRGRLRKAIKSSRQAIEPHRKIREELLRDYAGSWYNGKRDSKQKTLVNLMNQTAKIFTVALAANNPKVCVTTSIPEHWAEAKRFEINLNKLISDMNLAKTFRQIVMDAFFSIGIAVVCMRDSGTQFHALMEGEEDCWIDIGEPWLSRVSIDDAILDMTARDITKMRFCGHMYRADFKKVTSDRGYKKSVRDKLTPGKRSAIEGDTPRAKDIGSDLDDDELKDMIWLQNIWIPENGTVATMAVNQDLPPLLEREWIGGQDGPYKFLSLGLMPDNIMPSSPASNLKGLHDLQNRLFRHMERQSKRQKTVTVYQKGDDEEAKTHRDAQDGDWIGKRNPRDVVQVRTGGIDAANQAWSMAVQDVYNLMAGNPGARAGLGPQAGTAAQEGMIQSRINEQDADMHMAVLEFAAECCKGVGRLAWEDEFIHIPSRVQVEGVNPPIMIDSSWPPRDEIGNRIVDGEFDDLQLEVEVDSMLYKTSEQKVQEIMGTVSELAPLWPMFQAAGMTIDPEELLDTIARFRNRPELRRIIKSARPDMLPSDPHGATQSPVTRRETVRSNIPTGGTQQNRGAMLAQAIGSGAANNDQMGSLARQLG